MKHVVHNPKALLAIQDYRSYSQSTKVVQEVRLDVNQARFCLLYRFRLDAKRKILGFGQAIVALRQLRPQHSAVLVPHFIESIILFRNTDAFFKALRTCAKIHERNFKTYRAVKEIQETAPLFKDGGLIFILRQPVIDILKLNRLGVIAAVHPANAILKHPLKRNGLLCSPWDSVIMLCFFPDLFDLSPFLPGQVFGQLYAFCLSVFFPLPEQSHSPPSVLLSSASMRNNSCPSCMAALSAARILPR